MGGKGSGGNNQYWTDELIESELRSFVSASGDNFFPSVSDLRELGRNDLSCVVSKRGGFSAWAERLGMVRKHSDSDTGWEGEREFAELVRARGLLCEKPEGVKSPFDLLIESVLRVDVKSARLASYKNQITGAGQSGWYYRIGKLPQADIIVLFQLDTKEFFAVPWWKCPHGNMTIAAGVSKYAPFKNNWLLINQMIGLRMAERMKIEGDPVNEVA